MTDTKRGCWGDWGMESDYSWALYPLIQRTLNEFRVWSHWRFEIWNYGTDVVNCMLKKVPKCEILDNALKMVEGWLWKPLYP